LLIFEHTICRCYS